jgi:hypothetical protein
MRRRSLICAGVLSIAATFLGSCGSHVDSLIVMRLRASVTADNQPVRQAAIWLKDRRFKTDSQPSDLRNPICTTDSKGECIVEVRYSYGYVDWPWSRLIKRKFTLSERFEISVKKDGRLLARQDLAPLTNPQIQGAEEILVRIRLFP